MEATGVYWIPLYEILEQAGFEVCLVNGCQAGAGKKIRYKRLPMDTEIA